MHLWSTLGCVPLRCLWIYEFLKSFLLILYEHTDGSLLKQGHPGWTNQKMGHYCDFLRFRWHDDANPSILRDLKHWRVISCGNQYFNWFSCWSNSYWWIEQCEISRSNRVWYRLICRTKCSSCDYLHPQAGRLGTLLTLTNVLHAFDGNFLPYLKFSDSSSKGQWTDIV